MRESFGATWLLGLVLIFIVLFSSFIAIAINYTKAFRVKNEIINIIERHEGYTSENTKGVESREESAEGEIDEYLERIGYNRGDMPGVDCPQEIYDDNSNKFLRQPGNYCVRGIPDNSSGSTASVGYFKVTTFVMIEFPMLNWSAAVPVSGETKILHNIPENAGLDEG